MAPVRRGSPRALSAATTMSGDRRFVVWFWFALQLSVWSCCNSHGDEKHEDSSSWPDQGPCAGWHRRSVPGGMQFRQWRWIGERRQPEYWRVDQAGRFGRFGFRGNDHHQRQRWGDKSIRFGWRWFRGHQERRRAGIGRQRRGKPRLRRGYRFGRCCRNAGQWRLHGGGR
jgi:hypothetical protein